MLATDSPRWAAIDDTAELRKQVLVGRLFLGLTQTSIVCPFCVTVQALAVAEIELSGCVLEKVVVDGSLCCIFGM